MRCQEIIITFLRLCDFKWHLKLLQLLSSILVGQEVLGEVARSHRAGQDVAGAFRECTGLTNDFIPLEGDHSNDTHFAIATRFSP